MSNIRNFSIIAHIDHGKSTLADRLLEYTGTVSARDMTDRVLDTLELEQEKGITIKLQTARMDYHNYILNLIDTPGHVDFSYEVSRSLAASEGALLLVDATQGIQAQTFSTVYKALDYNLEIIPVVNKIDLPSVEVSKTIEEISANFGFNESEVILTSGKTGIGVPEVLQAIIDRVPPAPDNVAGPLQALIFDSFYHEHKGVVILVKLASGQLLSEETIYVCNSDLEVKPIEIGYLKPSLLPTQKISAGEVGYIATGLKDIRRIHVGDTVTHVETKTVTRLHGYTQPKSMVFASMYPVESNDFPQFQDGIDKLALNDAALTYQRESSQALGTGFSCGFLGLLHLEVTQERLEREFGLSLITTVPSVEYHLKLNTKDMSKLGNVNIANFMENGELIVRTAAEYPDQSLINEISEPWVKLEIITPDQYIGAIMELLEKHRGIYLKLDYLTSNMISGKKHVILKYEIPSAEIITDFFDKLKSVSQGYASMDYELIGYRIADIVKVAILVNYELVDPLSFLCHRSSADIRGRKLVSKLVDLIPRQQFKVPIQAAIGGQVISRETIQAYSKDVNAKMSGGDITRKMKLLEKQKKGKRRLKMFGKVEVPKEAFMSALST